jgi:hypothetical protein
LDSMNFGDSGRGKTRVCPPGKRPELPNERADFSFPCVAARTIVGVQMSLPLGFVRTAPTTYQLPTFHAARVRLEMYMPTANQRGHGKS